MVPPRHPFRDGDPPARTRASGTGAAGAPSITASLKGLALTGVFAALAWIASRLAEPAPGVTVGGWYFLMVLCTLVAVPLGLVSSFPIVGSLKLALEEAGTALMGRVRFRLAARSDRYLDARGPIDLALGVGLGAFGLGAGIAAYVFAHRIDATWGHGVVQPFSMLLFTFFAAMAKRPLDNGLAWLRAATSKDRGDTAESEASARGPPA